MFSPKLPYRMPASPHAKAVFLAQLMYVPPAWLSGLTADRASALLTDICLYRHLDRKQKENVIRRIRALPVRRQDLLMSKVLLPIVNPDWGVWSLTTEELLQQQRFLSAIVDWLGYLGLGYSFQSFGDLLKRLRARDALWSSYGVLPTIGIWGFYWMNDTARGQIEQELYRRANTH
ncbi:hypothetical protein [Alkalilimnicola sp. S0819]|uniref:hypothetical protein n=1 Tax=Alkalilimnicola sp. S0819 TaxID=2613922 RepID=UPI00126168F7|nr:hypothetical protein [Alkalilimnicola sp. S0819]KAB7622710.1 hypothetical protein F3N43_11965 [Alkalilimnicola sp. S0819]MPQ17350.1 hypothetical protein [Alkalilimnicola sp. S0819]